MKARGFLFLSLALNLALAGWLAARSRNPAAPSSAPVQRVSARTAPAPVAATDAPAPVETSTAPPPFQWHLVESDDDRQYLANLRAISCPERTVRMIVASRIARHYWNRLLDSPRLNLEPWANADRRKSASRSRREQWYGLAQEKDGLLRELFGPEAEDITFRQDIGEASEVTAVLGFLPEAKAVHVFTVADRLSRQRDRITDFSDQILLPEDRAKLRQFSLDLKTEIQRTLSPAELEEMQCRFQLHSDVIGEDALYLDGIELTGAELRRISLLSLSVADALDHEFGFDSILSEQDKPRRRAEFQEQVACLLGKARLADLARAQDEPFRKIYDFVHDKELPRQAAIKVYEARRTAEQEAAQLNADASLSPEQRAAVLRVLKNATERQISGALGEAVAPDYFARQGSWLEKLLTTPEPAAQPEVVP